MISCLLIDGYHDVMAPLFVYMSTQAMHAERLTMIEKCEKDMVLGVKAMSAKLKTALNEGSIAHDRQRLQRALSSAKERLDDMERVLSDGESVFKCTGHKQVNIDVSTFKQLKNWTNKFGARTFMVSCNL